MYHLFISGVTYLNSLWQAYRNGWRLVHTYVDALLDMQVCTSVMEGLAGEWAGSLALSWLILSSHAGSAVDQEYMGDGLGKDDPAAVAAYALGPVSSPFPTRLALVARTAHPYHGRPHNWYRRHRLTPYNVGEHPYGRVWERGNDGPERHRPGECAIHDQQPVRQLPRQRYRLRVTRALRQF